MRRFFILILTIFAVLGFNANQPAYADMYKVSLSSSHIQITSPARSGDAYPGCLSVSGSSDLREVWFCIRGPKNEMTTAKAEVKGGRFDTVIDLRMGPGQYTIWAGDNPSHFDGSVRFQVENQDQNDTRYISASVYVDAQNPEIVSLAQTLAPKSMGDMEKLRNIHDWIVDNISFDCDAYTSGQNKVIPASTTLINRKGMCRDYSFLLAALARASGMPARVIYGEATADFNSAKGLHAWNEVMVNGGWVSVDSCWDAGYIKNNTFVAAPSTKFFALETNVMSSTHSTSSIALY